MDLTTAINAVENYLKNVRVAKRTPGIIEENTTSVVIWYPCSVWGRVEIRSREIIKRKCNVNPWTKIQCTRRNWMGNNFFLEAFDEFEARIQVGSNFLQVGRIQVGIKVRYVEHIVQFQNFLKGVCKITHIIMDKMMFYSKYTLYRMSGRLARTPFFWFTVEH